MCYAAQIKADFRKFTREYGAVMSLRQFFELFWQKRKEQEWQKLPKAMRVAFAHAGSAEDGDAAERELAALIAAGDRELANALEAELFRQRARLAEAERALAGRPTRKAENEQRIAADKIARLQQNLADLQRVTPTPEDAMIFPGYYAPVMIEVDGRRTIVPMRYRCRLAGWDVSMERKKPGTYNARRDNLETAWRQLFGYRHGILPIRAFHEHVARHRLEHRELGPDEKEQSVVLEFRPDPPQDLLIACLWSRHKGEAGEPDLYSFAAITDEPPPEVAAAGHDRCVIPIRPQHVDAWLNPDPANLAALYAILDDRERPFFEYRLAA
ncbi:hypothetical protein CR3_3810 [Cupriavidus gilardii CR3]|uniref:DUF159 family protein n=1 Tax=Cupriavidus gilardii TaxID=82541 RepID=A0A849BDU8_9BURK|nr:SOS response-associated peptidase family protein [Cupriavidus gilardii]ALD92996.1 hypothetical protein CR3_3810 [Cupriavidus gilardii CR3]KAB0599585.1 DUF159 family protein [Cupriavidus gilardii]MCT9012897.1 SOS response-associated peptidase [Cupriavidus gilardii]MCT9052451.1 SOS response-associated peptidase [Cupriavidus gilardii]NNH10797.1 DUF159 family protein [Cupriavidus gilardii]